MHTDRDDQLQRVTETLMDLGLKWLYTSSGVNDYII